MSSLPILDCGAIGLNVLDKNVDHNDVEEFGKQLVDSCASVGFCYLTNHGISKDQLDGYMEISRAFFEQTSDRKRQLKHQKKGLLGWIPTATERLAPEKPVDLREVYRFSPGEQEEVKGSLEWPINEFLDKTRTQYDMFKVLALRMCDCLSVGLGVEKSLIRNGHSLMGMKGNITCLQSHFYPPVLDDSLVEPGQTRLLEHTDFDTMTMVYQDDVGGLEVEIPGQGFVPVPPRQGTIVLNFGDALQQWTADRLTAANHRVVIPEAERKRRTFRQSIGFFSIADSDYVIKPMDGSDKYPPITGLDYCMGRCRAAGLDY